MAIGGPNTSWQHGTNAAPTSLTDYTSSTMQVNFARSAPPVDSTRFGSSNRQYDASYKEATVSVTYYYSDSLYAALQLLFNNGTAVSFQYSPNGTTTGKPRSRGSMFATSCQMSTSPGDVQTIEVEFQVTGDVDDTAH